MKPKTIKKAKKTAKKLPKENKQIVEIHIYIHQNYTNVPTITQPNTFPPYQVTC